MHPIQTITVTGTDAFEFLQAQLTNDLRRLESGAEILAAWCSPKGRVIWFGTVFPIDNGYGLSAPADTADAIVQRMTMFRFRSKVEFGILDAGQTVDPAHLIEHGHPYIGSLTSSMRSAWTRAAIRARKLLLELTTKARQNVAPSDLRVTHLSTQATRCPWTVAMSVKS
jgi:folate-binding Fe-S cluster repair protein YgfZ